MGPKDEPYQGFIPYRRPTLDDDTILTRSSGYFSHITNRRSVRHFSSRPVPKAVIEKIILAAASAPSGAHKQPWTFCAISDPDVKAQIRQAAERRKTQLRRKNA